MDGALRGLEGPGPFLIGTVCDDNEESLRVDDNRDECIDDEEEEEDELEEVD